MVSIPPGSALGRYRVIEQLGRGGMATVFRCHDPNLDRFVAVKVLPSFYTEDPSFLGRFTQEAQAIARLNHPNILQIYDFGDDKGYTFIVSELVPGGTLEDRLTGQPMAVDQVLAYMAPLAEALDFAHANQILHRDMKPGNVLINDSEQPILADFGLARMLESSTRFTQAQQALGTPEYMAPEQALGADSDHRADLYAMGIMAYQMLVGQTPFKADTPAATLMAHIHRDLPLPRLMNPDLDEAIEMQLLKALAKDPDDRFQSATEMIQAFEKASGITTSSIRPAPPPPRAVTQAATTTSAAAHARGSSGFSKWLIGAGAAIVAAILVAVLAFMFLLPLGEDGQQAAAANGANVADSDPSAVASAAQVGSNIQSAGDAPRAANASASNAVPGEIDCSNLPTSGATDAGSVASALSQLQKMQNATQEAVAELRGIDPAPAVATTLRTRQELCEITKGFYRRRDVRDQLFEAEELYKTLGLMPAEQSLEQILLGIQLQQVSALFDDVSGDVYVLSDATEITPRLEVGYASAYMGGLQQALFDVTALRDGARAHTGDRFRAVTSLVSGDVAVVTGGYIDTVIAQEPGALEELEQPIPDNKLTSAPAIVRKTALFPLTQGRDFVAALFAEVGSWEGVNRAYQTPPESSEQILHPDRYFDREPPTAVSLPDVSELMSRGWSLTATDTMGEFLLRSYLEEHLDAPQAAAAAAGWGGDQYLLMSNPQLGRLLLAQLHFDSIQDAEEFYQAFQAFMGAATEGTQTRVQTVSDTGQLWSTEGGKTVFLGESPPAALLIVGDDFDAVEEALQKLGEAMQSAANINPAQR